MVVHRSNTQQFKTGQWARAFIVKRKTGLSNIPAWPQVAVTYSWAAEAKRKNKSLKLYPKERVQDSLMFFACSSDAAFSSPPLMSLPSFYDISLYPLSDLQQRSPLTVPQTSILFPPSVFHLNTPPSLLFPTRPPPAVSPPSDQAYLQAAAIFQQLRAEKTVAQQLLHYEKKTDTWLPESGDKTTQRQAYQLAFSTLKCMITEVAHIVFRNHGKSA